MDEKIENIVLTCITKSKPKFLRKK